MSDMHRAIRAACARELAALLQHRAARTRSLANGNVYMLMRARENEKRAEKLLAYANGRTA